MKKITTLVLIFGILLSVTVLAHSDEDFSQAKEIINQKISCNSLTQDQLEIIGDYYMEQMHPGEAHEYMDEMMGGEGSESLRAMHINMAKNIYCGESTNYNSGYGMMSNGGYGMMGMMYGTNEPGMIGYSSPSRVYGFYGYGLLIPLALAIVIVLLTILVFSKTKRK